MCEYDVRCEWVVCELRGTGTKDDVRDGSCDERCDEAGQEDGARAAQNVSVTATEMSEK